MMDLRLQSPLAPIVLTLALVAAGAAPATAVAGPVPKDAPATVADGFTLAAGGDLLGYYHPLTPEADADLRKVGQLLHAADAGFANREGNVFDLATFTGAPGAETGGFDQMGVGGGPLATAATAADMKRFGLNLLSLANNHAMDWGADGLAATERTLDEAGVAHAGSGRSRAAARAPAFAETPHGRVALVATASTYLPMSVAGPGSGERNPRPGISALRNTPVTLVSAAELAVLKAVAARQGMGVAPDAKEVTLDPNTATFNGQTFRLSEHGGMDYRVDAEDRQEILDAVRAAKRGADFAVLSIHAHETDSGGQEHLVDPAALRPASFLQPLFHAAVDAGADAVVTHGPHTLRGIEIYKGRPIFYGLGSLFFAVNVPGYTWPRAWYDSVLAVSVYKRGRLDEVRLYPLVLRQDGDAPARSLIGSPRLATGPDAQRILAVLREQSAPYGTRIEIVGDTGVIHAEPPEASARS